MESNTKQAGVRSAKTHCFESLEILANSELKSLTNIRICSIKLFSKNKEILIGLQVIYYDITNEKIKHESERMIGEKSKTENNFEIDEISLENTEYIVCIICKSDEYINYILLITSEGRYIELGNSSKKDDKEDSWIIDKSKTLIGINVGIENERLKCLLPVLINSSILPQKIIQKKLVEVNPNIEDPVVIPDPIYKTDLFGNNLGYNKTFDDFFQKKFHENVLRGNFKIISVELKYYQNEIYALNTYYAIGNDIVPCINESKKISEMLNATTQPIVTKKLELNPNEYLAQIFYMYDKKISYLEIESSSKKKIQTNESSDHVKQDAIKSQPPKKPKNILSFYGAFDDTKLISFGFYYECAKDKEKNIV